MRLKLIRMRLKVIRMRLKPGVLKVVLTEVRILYHTHSYTQTHSVNNLPNLELPWYRW